MNTHTYTHNRFLLRTLWAFAEDTSRVRVSILYTTEKPDPGTLGNIQVEDLGAA